MREWQLEYGAEIGRAVVNFDGPIVFCVVSRYHGGAFVVFSQRLNEELEAVAARGRARVGHRRRARRRGRVRARRRADRPARRPHRRARRAHRARRGRRAPAPARRARGALGRGALREARRVRGGVRRVHSVERAVRMGSVSRIIAPAALRPFLIEAVERGMARTLEHERSGEWPRRAGSPAAHADVPAGDGWLGSDRAPRARRPADRAAPRRLAARALDGEGRARAPSSALPARAHRDPGRGGRGARGVGVGRASGRVALAQPPRRAGARRRGRRPGGGRLRPRGRRAAQRRVRSRVARRVRAGARGRARRRRPRPGRQPLWTAKEAVAKVRREGLRLDVRHAVVDAQSPGPGWRTLRVHLDGDSTAGWWREEPGWVMSVAGEPAPAQPCPLDGVPRRKENRWLCTT